MRKLQVTDLFNLTRIVKKLNLKDEIKNIDFTKGEYSLGFDLIFLLIDKATEKEAEYLIYKFLSEPFEMTVDEVKKLDPIELVENVFLIASIEKWKTFIKQASQLI